MKSFIATMIVLTPLLFADPVDENEEVIATVESPTFSEESLLPHMPDTPPPPLEIQSKSTFGAVGLSMLYPGLGHAYLNEYRAAGGLAGSFSAGIGAYAADPSEDKLTSGLMLSNTWFYGVYSAYRDARIYNDQRGYRYTMPNDSFMDLVKAPFQISVMKKPAVWGGILGFLTAGAVISHYAFPQANVMLTCSTSDPIKINPALALPVGIGEEALFRGYLQSYLTEISSPVPAIIGQALLFGAVHIPNAEQLDEKDRASYYTFAVPLITTFGAYMGWVTHKTNSLKYSTAMHTWYDFILFSADALNKPKASIGKRRSFAYSFTF